MFRKRKFLTCEQLQAEVDSWSDEEDSGQYADKINVIITPPDDVDAVSDNEELDENIQIVDDDNEFPSEVAGNFEVEYIFNSDNPILDKNPQLDEDISLQPSSSKKARNNLGNGDSAEWPKSKWSRRQNYKFDNQPFDNSANAAKALYEKIGSLSALQLWECFMDSEVLQLIVDNTNEYAAQNNIPGFLTKIQEIRTFIGILYLTGYHTLPTIHAYWSNSESLGCQLVKRSISRDRFKRIKQNLHVCDNNALDQNDKFAKISPLNELINQKFMQFGIFSHNLAIDEQMIPYYGRHSCKMFIKSKPIRFGYKYWCLASSEGYCYQFMPYAGASSNSDSNFGLGENVVLKLLSQLETPKNHNITFDNFFTSHKLMGRLNSLGYFATGTVRDNRINHAPLLAIKDMKKKPRGSSDFVFDQNNKVLLARWNDNSVVTLMSNFLTHTPMSHAKRYDRKNRKMTVIDQPLMIREYNQHMGGVDLFDNAMNNYRIKVRGKKWYWPLLVNAFDAAMVNAWKLKVFCAKYENSKPMSQFDFRVEVAEALITQPVARRAGGGRSTNANNIVMRTDGFDHIIEKLDKRARCKQCGGKIQFGCKKCDVLIHPKKCFLDFHNGVAPDKEKIKKAK